MSSAASIKDRLKNKSMSTGKTMEELLVLYGLERTIYRISVYINKTSLAYMISLGGFRIYS